MKTYKLMAFLFIFGISFSCSDDDGVSQAQEAQNLEEMLTEIKDLASNKKCKDETEWTFTSYGSKACGGPVGYIAYSTTIDTTLFLDKIAEHRIAQNQFNEKWGITSDCSVPQEPEGVICEDGEAVFIY